LEPTTMIFVFAVILLAGLMQAITGFAYALIAIPLLVIVTSPREAVSIVLFTGMLMKLLMVCKTRHDGNFSSIALIFGASVVGSLPGIYLMRLIDDTSLKIFISIALIVCVIAMGCNVKISIRRHRLAQTLVGVTSGFLGATAGFNGPPVILYMMNENEGKVAMRANLVRYFLLGNFSTLVLSSIAGSLPLENLLPYALISIPAIGFAGWLGEKLFAGINPLLFRRIAMGIVCCSAVLTLFAALTPWIMNTRG
jgi:uncharacterized protein